MAEVSSPTNVWCSVKKSDFMTEDRPKSRNEIRTVAVTILQFLLTGMLILCSVATLLQFLHSRLTISTSDLHFCISRTIPAGGSHPQVQLTQNDAVAINVTAPASPPPQAVKDDVVRREFKAYGAAAYSFIAMGAYHGGPGTFTIVGLASKTLHVYARPTYECVWVPRENAGGNISAVSYKILPDWGYGKVYTVVVVNCTFSGEAINADNSGGELLLVASTTGGGDRSFNVTDTIPIPTELPGSVNFTLFSSKPKYDYFYCGSSLYGNLSPQRVREWLAYHVRLFGARSHFVIHDAGGVHKEVMEVLRPWI